MSVSKSLRSRSRVRTDRSRARHRRLFAQLPDNVWILCCGTVRSQSFFDLGGGDFQSEDAQGTVAHAAPPLVPQRRPLAARKPHSEIEKVQVRRMLQHGFRLIDDDKF